MTIKTLRRRFSWLMLSGTRRGGWAGPLGFEVARMLEQFGGEPDEIQIILRKKDEEPSGIAAFDLPAPPAIDWEAVTREIEQRFLNLRSAEMIYGNDRQSWPKRIIDAIEKGESL